MNVHTESLAWHHLLGIPYERGGRTTRGLDCAGVVEQVNILLGHLTPDQLAFQFSGVPSRMRLEFEEFMEQASGSFDLIGRSVRDATSLGDFVVADPKGGGYSAHAYVLVQHRPRTFLTTLLRGSVHAVQEHRIQGVVSAHRIKRVAS